MVSMLYKTNIFALVGSENNREYKRNQVLIWDDLSSQILFKITLNENVLNLKLRVDKVFIVCQNQIYILNSKNEFIIIGIVETGLNPNGLLAINYNEENPFMVFPSCEKDKDKGELTIKNLNNYVIRYFSPHKNKVTYISSSYDGTLLVTASEEGKKIRIFEAKTLKQLEEFNRGKEKAEIKYISIDMKNQFLAASSERGTIHIWSLSQSLVKNTESLLSGFPSFLGGGFFDNKWSFAQVRLDEPYSKFHFGLDNSLIIITSSGKYYKAKIDPKKREIAKLWKNFACEITVLS